MKKAIIFKRFIDFVAFIEHYTTYFAKKSGGNITAMVFGYADILLFCDENFCDF